MNPATATVLAAPRAEARGAAKKAAATRPRRRKPTCGNCFFGARGLCALEQEGPCPTHRPDSPDGLVPPQQPALLMRQGAANAVA